MVVTDPSIDPITGLPVLNPSGSVQQIPLGQEVFPYADLNATAQPTRGPIYGDDIIPTSSLITAPDDQLKPRSIQSTRTRELRVREAVFQNLGAAIPDGTTAPVDVNVVSGGGGGGGGISPNWFSNVTNQVEFSTNAQDEMLDGPPNGGGSLYSVNVAAILNPTRGGSPPTTGFGFLWISVRPAGGGFPIINLGTMSFLWNGTAGGSECCQTFHRVFPQGITVADMGFGPTELLGLWYQTWNAPYDISGEWCWKI